MDVSKLLMYIWGTIRFILIIVNNLYCIPTHCLWLLTLWPLKWFSPEIYLTLEGFGFQWLLSMVSAWSYTAGYDIVEMGDDIQKIVNDKALMLINHQSTSDVPLIMAALDGRSRNIMWIMDRMFMKTNFGVVSWFHKDFFISSGKARREQSLTELTVHLSNVYMPCKRTWILLFPEGGFLRKRREISRKFALQNSLPILHHTTIPRVGAVQNVVATIGPQRAKMMANGNGNLSPNWANDSLKWIIDLTIAYPDGKPLDILTIFMASAAPCNTIFHYRCYPISEVPTDNELLKQWVYDRYIEKDSLLAKYYETGKFPDHRRPGEFCRPRPVLHDGFRTVILHVLYITSTLFHWNLLTLLFSSIF
ncbi:hypothetical protein GHT06_011757 [Daphnia sinensis]|uniref:Phospholipid/glycerol acyltransferase domain-containing protein n=1 Tax=Daphnia sinensis TaxID=1820382 RepID=A0AAD5PZ89_9CRUS|nr:hypothetical protein GHT06_011757 [Daphnia sinensis]